MLAADVPIWREFRLQNRRLWHRVRYNVHVGHVPGDAATLPAAERLQLATLYAKRIDVVAELPGET
jgi:hypothetical protein